jgi:uncharacterized protein YndB with AHSA1/START domain
MTQTLKPSAHAEMAGDTIQTLRVQKEMLIKAPPEIVFESILEEMGPAATGENGSPMPMKVEDDATRLKFVHRAIGLIDPKHAKGVDQGWGEFLDEIRKIAERRNER